MILCESLGAIASLVNPSPPPAAAGLIAGRLSEEVDFMTNEAPKVRHREATPKIPMRVACGM